MLLGQINEHVFKEKVLSEIRFLISCYDHQRLQEHEEQVNERD